MKNMDKWQESKYSFINNTLKASRDPNEVAVSSRLITDLVASFYEKYIPQFCKGKLIDLGCGEAPLYCIYKKYTTEIICIDWPKSFHKKDYVDVECSLTDHLPFRDNEFNTIILSDVLEHLPDVTVLWREMYRILQPEGKLLLNTPFYYPLHETPYDYCRYSEYALRNFAENVGFSVILIEAIGGVPEILADIIAKQICKRKIFCKWPAVFVQNLALRFSKRGFSKRTRRMFPFGYFVVAQKAV